MGKREKERKKGKKTEEIRVGYRTESRDGGHIRVKCWSG